MHHTNGQRKPTHTKEHKEFEINPPEKNGKKNQLSIEYCSEKPKERTVRALCEGSPGHERVGKRGRQKKGREGEELPIDQDPGDGPTEGWNRGPVLGTNIREVKPPEKEVKNCREENRPERKGTAESPDRII